MDQPATRLALGVIMVGADPGVAAAISRIETQMEGLDARIEKIEKGVDGLTAFFNAAEGGKKIVFAAASLLAGIAALFFGAWGVFHK